MPETAVCLYCEADGTSPVLEWLDALASRDHRAYLKCVEVIERPGVFGHELRRPTADLVSDGIHELRARVGRVNDRILSFFHGRDVALLAHAITKEKTIPNRDLATAIARKHAFSSDPDSHTYTEREQ